MLNRIIQVVTLALFCFCLTGCVKHVTAKCQPQAPDIAGFGGIQTQGLGFINIAGIPVGEVFELDPVGTDGKKFYANHVGAIQYSSAPGNPDYTEAPPQDTTVQVAISWDLSGDVSEGSSDAGSIHAALDDTLNFQVTHGIRAYINNVLVSLNQPNNANVKTIITGHPELTYIIVNPVELGDRADLAVSQAIKVDASVKLGWAVTADVAYNCKSDAMISSIPSGPHATLIIYPEFVKSDTNGAINHVGGTSGSHMFVKSGAREITSEPIEAAKSRRQGLGYTRIILCKKSGNDLSVYPGCKNQ